MAEGRGLKQSTSGMYALRTEGCAWSFVQYNQPRDPKQICCLKHMKERDENSSLAKK